MFIFSDVIMHALRGFIYNLVAVLYNDILLFRGAKTPEGLSALRRQSGFNL